MATAELKHKVLSQPIDQLETQLASLAGVSASPQLTAHIAALVHIVRDQEAVVGGLTARLEALEKASKPGT